MVVDVRMRRRRGCTCGIDRGLRVFISLVERVIANHSGVAVDQPNPGRVGTLEVLQVLQVLVLLLLLLEQVGGQRNGFRRYTDGLHGLYIGKIMKVGHCDAMDSFDRALVFRQVNEERQTEAHGEREGSANSFTRDTAMIAIP